MIWPSGSGDSGDPRFAQPYLKREVWRANPTSHTIHSVTVLGILASVLSLTVGLLPMAAPEHVHAREDHGHAGLVVHRHMPPHGLLDHHREHQASVEDDDAPILTLTTVYTVPASVVLSAPERLMSALIEPPAPERIERSRTKCDVPIHGPPRAPSVLRGPPFSPAS